VSDLLIPSLDAPALVRYGLPELVIGANPAAGADFTQVCDGRYYTRLISVFVRLVASATVASREVVISFEDSGGNRYCLDGINTTVTASNTADYSFCVFHPEAVATVDSSALVPLSAILMRPTDQFKIHVANVQAGDQLSRIRFVWERFFTTGQPPGLAFRE
jgi:hypothetical protein